MSQPLIMPVSKFRPVGFVNGKTAKKLIRQAHQRKLHQVIAGDEKKGPREMREHPGRPVGMLPGAWVASDLSERRIMVNLCSNCRPKFDEKRHGYVVDWMMQWAGKCDGCRQHSDSMLGFIHETQIGTTSGCIRDPVSRR